MIKREKIVSIRYSIILFGKSFEFMKMYKIVIIVITVFVLKKEKNTEAFAFFFPINNIKNIQKKIIGKKKQSSASQIMQKKNTNFKGEAEE